MKLWTGIASVVAAATVVAVVLVWVPVDRWTTSFTVAIILVGCSIIAPSFLPAPRFQDASNGAANIWLIGPLSTLFAVLLALALGAAWLALVGHERGSLVAGIIWAGALVVGYAALNASTRVVSSASSQISVASDDDRTIWLATVRGLSATSEEQPVRHLLDALAERIRYAANDGGAKRPTENEAISTLVRQLATSVLEVDTVRPLTRSVESLLEQRENALRATRSRA